MALPTTIVSDVGLAGHHPPSKSSTDNFYSVVRADADELDVYKATDPEDSWTVQGTGPVHAGTILGFSTYQDGDIIHIVAWSSATYEYYTFNMATDAWVIDELLITPTNAPTFPWASIAVRSGVPVVAYAGDTDQVMGGKKERVDAAHRDGGTWTTGIALDAAGDIHYGNPNVVKGPLTDDMHVLWQKSTSTTDPPPFWTETQGRTLDSSNSLSTTVEDTGDTGTVLLGIENGISYDDSGTQRMGWPGVDANNDRYIFRATEDGNDDFQFDTEVAESDEVHINGEVSIITLTELSGDLHVLFSGGETQSTDQDLFYLTSTDDGATWSTPTEEIDGITVNFISANIYVRDIDTVMAYIYDDGGVQKYNEKVLIAGQTHQMMI